MGQLLSEFSALNIGSFFDFIINFMKYLRRRKYGKRRTLRKRTYRRRTSRRSNFVSVKRAILRMAETKHLNVTNGDYTNQWTNLQTNVTSYNYTMTGSGEGQHFYDRVGKSIYFLGCKFRVSLVRYYFQQPAFGVDLAGDGDLRFLVITPRKTDTDPSSVGSLLLNSSSSSNSQQCINDFVDTGNFKVWMDRRIHMGCEGWNTSGGNVPDTRGSVKHFHKYLPIKGNFSFNVDTATTVNMASKKLFFVIINNDRIGTTQYRFNVSVDWMYKDF